MTPDDWDKCREPQRMLRFLRDSGGASERKLRLFACACCRSGLRGRRSLYEPTYAAAEEYADGRASREEVRRHWGPASDLPSWPEEPVAWAWSLAAPRRPAQRPRRAGILRDLFSPSHPLLLDPSCLTPPSSRWRKPATPSAPSPPGTSTAPACLSLRTRFWTRAARTKSCYNTCGARGRTGEVVGQSTC